MGTIGDGELPAQAHGPVSVAILPSETVSAKEDKESAYLLWKSPRLSYGADKGLQCGLSGNPVSVKATHRLRLQRETA